MYLLHFPSYLLIAGVSSGWSAVVADVAVAGSTLESRRSHGFIITNIVCRVEIISQSLRALPHRGQHLTIS